MPIWLWLTVRHGKIHPFLGKPSISMGHLYHGYVSHNQRVYAETSRSDSKRFQRNSKGLWLWHDIFLVNQRYKKQNTTTSSHHPPTPDARWPRWPRWPRWRRQRRQRPVPLGALFLREAQGHHGQGIQFQAPPRCRAAVIHGISYDKLWSYKLW